jgi:cell fate (sporulation/competence/biofilm development) regulator YlbF (YheA/YmcA/DUF963 family)
VSMTSIIKLAKELGEAIADSDEMRSLKEAEAAVEQNNNTKVLYQKYQKAKFKRIKSQLLNEEMPSDFNEIEKKAKNDPLVSNLIKKQEVFNNLIRTVNAVIAHSIEKTPVTGCIKGCGHDCGKCKEGVLKTTHGYTDDKTIQGDKK